MKDLNGFNLTIAVFFVNTRLKVIKKEIGNKEKEQEKRQKKKEEKEKKYADEPKRLGKFQYPCHLTECSEPFLFPLLFIKIFHILR